MLKFTNINLNVKAKRFVIKIPFFGIKIENLPLASEKWQPLGKVLCRAGPI